MMNGQAEHGKKDIRHFRDLDVCKLAFAVAMKVYEITKAFPTTERYSLVDQVRYNRKGAASLIVKVSQALLEKACLECK